MRGAQRRIERIPEIRGIIPADAGSTIMTRLLGESTEDHPRGCGEHTPRRDQPFTPEGSSPRMRGALGCLTRPRASARIIPADAGSTFMISSCLPRNGDHPRGCGEHKFHRSLCEYPMGSSPRMRGAQVYGANGHGNVRIIPADAGSTKKYSPMFAMDEDHPRGCGEHPSLTIWRNRSSGSSPRMRGAR